MKRKIIKQGIGGYTIYLPKKWVDDKGIATLGEVELKELDEGILITGEQKTKKAVVLNITPELENHIKTLLTHAYRSGFDKITINNITEKLSKHIRETVRDLLLGFEITQQSEKQIIIENLSEPTDEKYDVMMRRIFLIIKESINRLREDTTSKNWLNTELMKEYRLQQDKLVLFCRRLIMKEKHVQQPIIQWELLTFLMHIEHAIYYCYNYLSAHSILIDKKIVSYMNLLDPYFELYYGAYFKNVLTNVAKINELHHIYHEQICVELSKNTSKQAVVYSYLREVFRLIQIGTSPTVSKLIDQELTEK